MGGRPFLAFFEVRLNFLLPAFFSPGISCEDPTAAWKGWVWVVALSKRRQLWFWKAVKPPLSSGPPPSLIGQGRHGKICPVCFVPIRDAERRGPGQKFEYHKPFLRVCLVHGQMVYTIREYTTWTYRGTGSVQVARSPASPREAPTWVTASACVRVL